MPIDAIRELEESLILCYTGLTHDSGDIHRINLRIRERQLRKKYSEKCRINL